MPIKIKTFDLTLFAIPLVFLVASVAIIYSLVFGTVDSSLAFKQGIIAVIGFFIMTVVCFVDYRFFRGTYWIFYLIGMSLLVFTNFTGKIAGGAQSWLTLGFFQLQPSEIIKAILIFSLASIFSPHVGRLRIKDIIWSLIILLPALGLILSEPDFGSALVVVFIYISMILAARPSKMKITLFFIALSLLVGILSLSAFNVAPFRGLLHQYQRERILTFFHPESDPYGSGYNVRQAQISVGSGGLFGKGLGQGSQSQLQFLPKPHTDFIFAEISESFGFIGATLCLLLYLFLILRILNIAHLARDNFGMFICFGTASMFLFQVLINVGMNIGLVPVTGITLPLLSYGGTSVVVSLFMIGLVQSVFLRHKKITF